MGRSAMRGVIAITPAAQHAVLVRLQECGQLGRRGTSLNHLQPVEPMQRRHIDVSVHPTTVRAGIPLVVTPFPSVAVQAQ